MMRRKRLRMHSQRARPSACAFCPFGALYFSHRIHCALASQYVCSLRWAFSVMSDTEAGARYCLYEGAYPVNNAVRENLYMLAVGLVGAILHAAIYGNITEVVRSFDSSGSRLTKRLATLHEFFAMHHVPKKLQHRIREQVRLACACAPERAPPSESWS